MVPQLPPHSYSCFLLFQDIMFALCCPSCTWQDPLVFWVKAAGKGGPFLALPFVAWQPQLWLSDDMAGRFSGVWETSGYGHEDFFLQHLLHTNTTICRNCAHSSSKLRKAIVIRRTHLRSSWSQILPTVNPYAFYYGIGV